MRKFLTKIFSARTLAIILLFLEIAIIALLVVYLQEWLAEIKAIMSILAIIVALFIFNNKSSTSYKLFWLIMIIILPVFGSVAYILFANKKFTKHEKKSMRPSTQALKRANASEDSGNILKSIDREKDPNAYFFGKYLNDYSHNGIFENTKVSYYPWGEDAWAVMLEKMKEAKHYLFLEYFIIEEGKMWNAMRDIMIEKAKEGVDVRLLYDDLGCMSTLPPAYYKKMRKAGIKCYAVNKIRPFLDIRMNNRDHRKIMVIDGHTGFTGGINLADEYINEKERFGKWKDNAVMLEGDGVFGLTSLYLSHWSMIDKKHQITDFSPYLPNVYIKEKGKIDRPSGYVAPYGSLPFVYETVGETVYIDLILKAKKYIYITTPYLILGEELENALCKAAKGGVKIKLLTPHIPDKKTVFDLTRSYYRRLTESGVEVYEYTPGFVHAKTFVVDGEMATVGTINLDYRSLYLHMENGCFMYKCECIKDIEKDMIETFAQSERITYEMIKSSPVSKRVWRFFLRLFSSAL